MMINRNMDARLQECFFYTNDRNEKIPVCPLMLAVSGHRHIASDSMQTVKNRIHEFFLNIGATWHKEQKTDRKKICPAPVLVLCGMAVGADFLAAEEVLRLKKERPELNYRLAAVLPMPQKIYEEDFKEGEERQEFLRQLDGADYVMELPLSQEAQDWLDSRPSESLPAEYRVSQYEELGKYLAANSLYLLAIWDGIEFEQKKNESAKTEGEADSPDRQMKEKSRGGTADVVRMKIEGVVSGNAMPIALKNFPVDAGIGSVQPVGSVFQIVTPRVKQGEVLLARGYVPGDIWVHSPTEVFQGDRIRCRRKRIRNLSRYFTPPCPLRFLAGKKELVPFTESAIYNHDSCRFYDKLSEERLQSKKYLFGGEKPNVSNSIDFMTEYYSNADTLSLHFQNRFFNLAKIYLLTVVLFALAFYVICYGFSANQTRFPDVLLFKILFTSPSGLEYSAFNILLIDIVYFALLVILLVLFLYNKYIVFYERYHRYRALAEILRVQIFWNLSGIDDDAFNHYWNHQIMKLNWLRFTAKSILMTVCPDKQTSFETVKKCWVSDQYNYFLKKIQYNKREDFRWNTLGTVFMIVMVAGWFPLRILVNRVLSSSQPTVLYISFAVTIILAMTGVGGVCCFVWNRLKSNGTLVHRYSKIVPIYNQTLAALARIDQYEGNCEMDSETANENRRSVLRYLGEAALTENVDWFLMTRKLELPK